MTTARDLTRAMQRSLSPSAGQLDALHRRLVTAGEKEGLVDVAYRTIDSPVGSLLLAATSTGLVRIAFAAEDHEHVLETLSQRISPRVLHHPQRLDETARQLEEYFAGHRRAFAVDLDLRLATGFRASVLRHLPDIAFGRTASYAAVAEMAGRPRAIRAVGTACASNPLPLVVPCHRVVKSDGSIGGYLGGPDAKAFLLDLETAA